MSSCVTWINSFWDRICLEISRNGIYLWPLGRPFTRQESLISLPSMCIPAWVLGVTHHLAKLSLAAPCCLSWQKSPYSVLSFSCLCLPCSTNPCRAARPPGSLSLWICTAFSLGFRGLVCINVIGKHIVQILAVAAKVLCRTSQGKRSLHMQQLNLDTAARSVSCWMWSRKAFQLWNRLSCSSLSHY